MQKEVRINQDIKARKVYLIDAVGINRGLVDTNFALRQASEDGFDLLEVSEKDGFPICKILDYGKHKYEMSKGKKSSAKIVVKEIKMSPRIDKHDIEVKLKQVNNWLSEGHKIYIAVQFRGRENSYKEIGFEILNNFKNVPGSVVSEPKLEGNLLSIWMTKAT